MFVVNLLVLVVNLYGGACELVGVGCELDGGACELVGVGHEPVGVGCECKSGVIIKQTTLMQTNSVTHFNSIVSYSDILLTSWMCRCTETLSVAFRRAV